MKIVRILRGSSQGFTLVELMIAVTVIGVLAGIAYPAYKQSVLKAKRGDAQAALMEAANAIERYRARNNFSYANAEVAGENACAGKGCPAFYSDRLPDTGDILYDVGFAADPDDAADVKIAARISPEATKYKLVAVPRAGGQMANDGVLAISSTGLKQWYDPACKKLKSNWSPKGQDC